jgi:Ser/Thr protein kinase RdoA (MazF antagonist)
MIKTIARPCAWQRQQMRDAGTLEQAAYAAGVAMPRPVVPPAPGIGLWQAVGSQYARAAAWVEGAPPPTSTVPLARWLGRTLATLDRLGLPADPAEGAAYTVPPMSDWRRWIARAHAAGRLERREAADTCAAVADLVALVAAGLAAGPAFQIGHRDANARNVLLTGRGPVLIDFDSAGPEVPWWGAVYHAWDLARADLPVLGPAVLDAYAEHGGRLGPAEPTAFAGLARGVLDGFAFHLRVVTGEHDVDPERRATALRNLPLFARGVPEVPGLIHGWVALLP